MDRARRLYHVVERQLPRIEKEAAVESPFGRSGRCLGRRVNRAAGGVAFGVQGGFGDGVERDTAEGRKNSIGLVNQLKILSFRSRPLEPYLARSIRRSGNKRITRRIPATPAGASPCFRSVD